MDCRHRVRWRCRRGLLELDLILERFLERHLDALDAAQHDALMELLEYPDNDLLDCVMGRAEPEDARLRGVLGMLRSV